MPDFIHPYNFVRLPDGGLSKDLQKHSLFGRHAAETHNRFVENKYSGYLDCELTTQTDWFIPSAEKVRTFHEKDNSAHPEHKTYGYFTLDEIKNPKTWFPQTDHTQPAIPGSSIRGMIRNVFEAATLSCFGEFDSRLLDFRFPRVLDQYKTANLSKTGRGAPSFIPVRLRKIDGEFYAELLEGRHHTDQKNAFPYANAVCYLNKVKDNGRAGRSSPLLDWVDKLNVKSGDPIAIVIRTKIQSRQKGRGNLLFRNVGGERIDATATQKPEETLGRASEFEKLKPKPGEIVVFGYWYRTGPNFMSKHDERVFFSWAAIHNFPNNQFLNPESCLNDTRQLKDRYETFLKWQTSVDKVVMTRLPAEVICTFESSIAMYNERTKNLDNNSPRHINQDAPHPSDFIDKKGSRETVEDGDLAYALVEKNIRGSSTIDSIYPVAVPRLRHPESRGNVLWKNAREFYPCKKIQEECEDCERYKNPNSKRKGTVKICDKCRKRHHALCPACRVFGWAREFDQYESDHGASDRVDAIAGHLQFSHGVLKPQPSEGRVGPVLITLPILDSPKPTFTDFYLRKKDSYTKAVMKRWPPAIQIHPSPLYRSIEAGLSGRKMYRRKRETKFDSNNPKEGGLIAPPDKEHPSGGYQGNQNQTVHSQPKNMVFKFRVDFDNLSEIELGALVFSLNLDIPKKPKNEGPTLHHMLGHGKSLGMGQSTIKIVDSSVKSHDRTKDSYKSWNGIGPSSQYNGGEEKIAACSKQFFEAWSSVDETTQKCWKDLTNMLSVVDIEDCSIHFPTRVVRGSQGRGQLPQFEIHANDHFDIFGWYEPYRSEKDRVPLPDPSGETDGTQQRLSSDPRKKKANEQ